MDSLLAPPLIAITGKAGAGKDTIRSILRKHFGYAGYAFADPLREMIQSLLLEAGVDLKYMRQREFKESVIPELGVSYRHLIQTLGTEWGRNCLNAEFWVKVLDNKIRRDYEDTFNPKRIVISDLRFHTEVAWVKANGGQVWCVVRDGAGIGNSHQSEWEMESIGADHIFVNTGTLDHLENLVVSHCKTTWAQPSAC